MGSFVAGFVFGLIVNIAFVIYLGKRAELREEREDFEDFIGPEGVQKAGADIEKVKKSINERMSRVRDITDEQLDLLQAQDGPQKNGLDGKSKNKINERIKALDDEKNGILISILEEGFDPEITTEDIDGIVTRIKLSEFMADMGITMPPKAKTESSVKQMGKFTVIKGGKPDDTTH